MTTVAELIVTALANHGVRSIWGVVGDALNPVTDAIRREERLEWVGVRHEEVGAFAAGAQAQLTGDLGVCMGTVGPGAVHLLNGLYDAKKSHAPVLAIVGQVPREDMGSEFFQEVDNQTLFDDVSVFNETLTHTSQLPHLLERAVTTALAERGVAVLSIPGDVGQLELPKGTPVPTFAGPLPPVAARTEQLRSAAAAVNDAKRVTLLVGRGALEAREEVLELAARLCAPMVLTLPGKEGLEEDNPYEVGQSGLIGNPATAEAFSLCDTIVLVGTDFPYRGFLPEGKTVVQLDDRGSHVGRRIPVDHPLVGDAGLTLSAWLPMLDQKTSTTHLDAARKVYETWQSLQARLTDPGYDSKKTSVLRRLVDNRDKLIRPEALAAALDRHAASDAVFTADTGMACVWISRQVRFGGGRQLLGSWNLGSMANAMPQALGAQALDRDRQVVAMCGDGGLSMLMGDLITAVSQGLPVKLVVFNNSRLGMVKLEMEEAGLPEFGTVLHNPDFSKVAQACGLHGVRVEDPADLDEAVAAFLAADGPALLDVVTNPEEIAIPPKPTAGQAMGFAIAKSKEFVTSPE